MTIAGPRFATDLVKALGLDGKKVTSLSLNVAYDSVPTITAEMYLPPITADHIVKVLRRYELVERIDSPIDRIEQDARAEIEALTVAAKDRIAQDTLRDFKDIYPGAVMPCGPSNILRWDSQEADQAINSAHAIIWLMAILLGIGVILV
jgi:hypothetical protein